LMMDILVLERSWSLVFLRRRLQVSGGFNGLMIMSSSFFFL
jgi:hypothetical protein